MILWLLFQILGGSGVLLLLEWLRERDGFQVPAWARLAMIAIWPIGIPLLTVFVVATLSDDEGAPDED